MMPRRAVVVDASIARSAGVAGASDPVSSACRDVLLTLLGTPLTLAMSTALDDEWRRHVSRFTRKWLVSMHARRRVRRLAPEPFLPLRQAWAVLPDGPRRRLLEKDAHLVDAAFAADRRVLSRDDEVRDELPQLAVRAEELGGLLWGNPVTPGCVEWVRAAMPEQASFRVAPARRLGRSRRRRR